MLTSHTQPSRPDRSKVSITYTAFVFVALLLAVAGGVITLFGLGGSTAFEFTVGDATINTTSSGLSLAALGLGAALVMLRSLPAGVEVAVSPHRTWLTRLACRRRELAFISAAVVVLAVVSILVT